FGAEVCPTHQRREGDLLSGSAARHHRHASGSDQRGSACLHRGATGGGRVTRELRKQCEYDEGDDDMTASAQRAQPIATRLLAGVTVPDTPMISRAIEFARERSEPYLFNHAMRSWLFAVLFAQRKQAEHDAEVLAVTTILHDIGLTESFDGPLRFEVEGANAARAFARKEGMDDRRTQLIWDGVALNSTPSIALYKEPEIAIATMGIGL